MFDSGMTTMLRHRRWDQAYLLLLSGLLWATHAVWLAEDTRPPVWDMALHQSYALNYLPAGAAAAARIPAWARSGNYPPFVHLCIAFCYRIFHPGPHVAVLANLPATLLLLWSVYALGSELAGAAAA